MQVWGENIDEHNIPGPNKERVILEVTNQLRRDMVWIDRVHLDSCIINSINKIADFGYLGYYVNILKPQLIEQIREQYVSEIEKKALTTLGRLFAPYLIHYLYNPLGIRVLALKLNFERMSTISQ